jgi:transposase
MFNASERTIRQWIVRYEAYGADGLNDKPRSGRPLKLSAAIQASVENDVRTDPAESGHDYSIWTVSSLRGSDTTIRGMRQDED